MHGGMRIVEPTGGIIGIQASSPARRISSVKGSAGAAPHQLLQDTPSSSWEPAAIGDSAGIAGEVPVTRMAPLASVIRPVSSVGSMQLAVESTRRKTITVPRDPAAESHGSLATAKSIPRHPVMPAGEADGFAVADRL